MFGAYAGFYDALYADKDYEAECDFLEPPSSRPTASCHPHLCSIWGAAPVAT